MFVSGAAVLADMYAQRSYLARLVRDMRRDAPHGKVRAFYLRHLDPRSATIAHNRRARAPWAYDGRAIPPRPTVARLREHARNLAAWANEPIRARYCGEDDAEAERKAAAYRESLDLRAAAVILADKRTLAAQASEVRP
jgi:hypothetical protein